MTGLLCLPWYIIFGIPIAYLLHKKKRLYWAVGELIGFIVSWLVINLAIICFGFIMNQWTYGNIFGPSRWAPPVGPNQVSNDFPQATSTSFTLPSGAILNLTALSTKESDIPIPTIEPPKLSPTPLISHNGVACIIWYKVTKLDLNKELCVYGVMYSYGPSPDKWNTLRFSPQSYDFIMLDFNYFYNTPLPENACVVIFGKIRDMGSYLFIAPDLSDANRIHYFEQPAACY